MAISQYDTQTFAAYKPISMQEMWAPAQQMREQHDKLQEEYALQEQQGALSLNSINPELDKNAYVAKQQYLEQTKAAADELVTKGVIDAGRRRKLAELKAIYNTKIIPYQNALIARSAKTAEYDKIKNEHPDWLGARPSGSLDDYLTNPDVYNYTGIKGTVLNEAASKDAKNFADQNLRVAIGPEKILQFKKLLHNYRGASADQVAKAVSENFDPNTADKIVQSLHTIRESVIDRFGVKEKLGNNPDQLRRAYEQVDAGLLSAMGPENTQVLDDTERQYQAHKADEAKQAPPPPGKSYVGYSSAFEPAEIAEGQRILDMSVVSGNSREAGRAMPGSPSTRNYKTSDDGSEYVRMVNLYAKKAGIEDRIPPGNHSKEDVEKRGEAIVRKAQESFKFANKSEFLPIDNKEFDTYLMNSLENKDGKIVDTNGKEHAPGSLFSEGRRELIFNKKGTVLSATTKDGYIVKIPVRDQSFGIASAQAPGQNPAFYENEHKSLGDDGFKSKYGYTLDQALGYIQSKTYNRATLQSKTKQKSEDVSPAYITPKL